MKEFIKSFIVLTLIFLGIVFINFYQINKDNYEKLNDVECDIAYGCVTNDNKIIKDNFIIKNNKIILKGYYKNTIFKSGVAENYYDLLRLNSLNLDILYDSKRVGNNLELVFNITPNSKKVYNKINEYNLKFDCFMIDNITNVDDVFNVTYEQNFYLYHVYTNSLNHFCDNLENQSNCYVDFAAYLRQ